MEHHLVLGVKLSERPHAEHRCLRNSFDLDRHAHLAAISTRGTAAGGAVDQPDGAVAHGARRALANRCAGGCLRWGLHTTGYPRGY